MNIYFEQFALFESLSFVKPLGYISTVNLIGSHKQLSNHSFQYLLSSDEINTINLSITTSNSNNCFGTLNIFHRSDSNLYDSSLFNALEAIEKTFKGHEQKYFRSLGFLLSIEIHTFKMKILKLMVYRFHVISNCVPFLTLEIEICGFRISNQVIQYEA